MPYRGVWVIEAIQEVGQQCFGLNEKISKNKLKLFFLQYRPHANKKANRVNTFSIFHLKSGKERQYSDYLLF